MTVLLPLASLLVLVATRKDFVKLQGSIAGSRGHREALQVAEATGKHCR